jgi:hypothetical protein
MRRTRERNYADFFLRLFPTRAVSNLLWFSNPNSRAARHTMPNRISVAKAIALNRVFNVSDMLPPNARGGAGPTALGQSAVFACSGTGSVLSLRKKLSVSRSHQFRCGNDVTVPNGTDLRKIVSQNICMRMTHLTPIQFSSVRCLLRCRSRHLANCIQVAYALNRIWTGSCPH